MICLSNRQSDFSRIIFSRNFAYETLMEISELTVFLNKDQCTKLFEAIVEWSKKPFSNHMVHALFDSLKFLSPLTEKNALLRTIFVNS